MYYLGPTLSSNDIFCHDFEKDSLINKECKFGDISKNWRVETAEDCRNKCLEHKKLNGPGCCGFSEDGACSFQAKGTVVNADSTTSVKRAVYCNERYNSGNTFNL